MIDKKVKNSELQKKAQISGNIITRLNKDEFVSMETIAKYVMCLNVALTIFWNFQKTKKGGTLQAFNKSEIQDLISNIERIDLKKLSDFIVSSTGLSHKDFMEQYSLTPYMLSRFCVFIRNEIEKGKLTDINGKTQEFNFASKFTEDYKKDECFMKYMTIHKAKGLEADCVLVVAENEKQLFKWLNITKTDMRNENEEDYRLGYVAFSRARKVLAVAVLEEIDISAFDTKIWDIV